MKKALKKRCFAFAIVFWLSFNTLFASVAYAKEYEDKYASNNLIKSRMSEEYGILYEVNNHSQTNQSAILYFVVQDYFNVIHNDFYYKFDGKFDENEEYSTVGFEFDLGMASDYNPLNEVMLGDEKAILCQAQFGIYPGYYNFYNSGYNYLARSSTTACFIKTLSPNFVLTEEDRYSNEFYVEVGEAENPILYAIVGEKEWIEKVEKDFEAWAKEYDEKLSTTVKEEDYPVLTPAPTAEPTPAPVVDENSEELRAIYSVNPRHYNEVKNDEAIEDVVSFERISTLPDSDEVIGSVTYVAVDGLGEPYGMGAHYLDYSVGCAPNPNEGYRLVTVKADNLSFHDVRWSEQKSTYNYWFLVPEGDVTIYCYYELKDYSITIDEELKGFLEYPPYADEGEMIKYCFDAPGWYSHNQVQFRLEDGTTQDIEPIKKDDGCYYFEMPNYNITLELKSNAQSNNNTTTEMVEESTVEKSDKPNVVLPIAVVGVVSVGTIAGVTYYKKKK